MGGHQQGFDAGIAMRMAGMIAAALAVVFILQKLGFKFVTAGSVSAGVGR